MKAQRTRRGTDGGWAGDMKLKKLKAARAKWLKTQQAHQRPTDPNSKALPGTAKL